jgi:hypothetical protein
MITCSFIFACFDVPAVRPSDCLHMFKRQSRYTAIRSPPYMYLIHERAMISYRKQAERLHSGFVAAEKSFRIP